MPSRGRKPPASRARLAQARPNSSRATSSRGSSSLSPIKSAHSPSAAPESEPPESAVEQNGADVDEDLPDVSSSALTFRYPAAVSEFTRLSGREQAFKVARFLPCTDDECDCKGLEPPEEAEVRLVSREEVNEVDIQADEDDVRTKEGWWARCGRCGHGWGGDGHTWAKDVDRGERLRRSRVVGRIEEILQDEDLLTTFPTPRPDSTESLFKQLHHFHRPSGGKRTGPPLPAPVDMTSPGAGTPETFGLGTPREVDEPPRKRSRLNGHEGEDGEEEDHAEPKTSPRHGKKPGKTGGTGKMFTKPRTVVRGARGLVPMETEPDGSQHVGGHLPDSAMLGNEGEEDDDDDVPLAKQRPQLEEGERLRREMIKEKEKEREEDLLRRVAEEDVEGMENLEIWEGVELPKLPARPAAVEQANNEIMLPVVASRNPTPVATILLIGLKNLFQKQLPKMPREYITRLVLDKNHISMAIVKRGWKVVGGICYRPFESRGFAEIVFCAVDSSEQIKGYGSHLMNSLKDHVRKAHPSINHFLTYADNYAVGYFKKQGFTKDITLDRERWVGYIKDYEGGTIMQCTMLPKVRYLEVHQMLADQKAAILAKIKSLTKSHIVHPGLQIFEDKKPGEIKLAKEDVPGLAETGWNPDLDAIMRQPKRNPHHGMLQLVLSDLQNEPSAWPFLRPVDGAVVHDYYDVITNPMDLSTMEHKLENNHYNSVEEFLTDARLIFDNCRQYNGEKSTYTNQANKLEKALDKILKKRQSAL